jgi:hypothetical protein
MDEKYYREEVVGDGNSGAWQGYNSGAHEGPHPALRAGVLVEFGDFGSGVSPYLAIDAAYAVGWDISTDFLAGFSYQFGQVTVSKTPKTPKPKPPPKVKKAVPVEVPEDEGSDDDDAGDWRDW